MIPITSQDRATAEQLPSDTGVPPAQQHPAPSPPTSLLFRFAGLPDPSPRRRVTSLPARRLTHINDSTLHPLAQVMIAGICFLAWLIEPSTNDSLVASSLLMFLRFVPVFVVGGSFYGRAGTGTIIGISLFFTLMATESVSVLLWDAHPVLQVCNFRPVEHAGNLAKVLYTFAGCGVLLGAAAIGAARKKSRRSYQKYVGWMRQLLVAVQLALIVELGYTALTHAVADDQQPYAVKQAKGPVHHPSKAP